MGEGLTVFVGAGRVGLLMSGNVVIGRLIFCSAWGIVDI